MADHSEEFTDRLEANARAIIEAEATARDKMAAESGHFPALDVLIDSWIAELSAISVAALISGRGSMAEIAEATWRSGLQCAFLIGYETAKAGVEMVPCDGRDHDSEDEHKLPARPAPGQEYLN